MTGQSNEDHLHKNNDTYINLQSNLKHQYNNNNLHSKNKNKGSGNGNNSNNENNNINVKNYKIYITDYAPGPKYIIMERKDEGQAIDNASPF